MPRFVILRHEVPAGRERRSHWDLMFECAGVLRTWATEREPGPAAEHEVRKLPDHRLAYLDYEGQVSGNRGTVARWDWGNYELDDETDDRWSIIVAGKKLRGRMTFSRGGAHHSWRVAFVAEPTSG